MNKFICFFCLCILMNVASAQQLTVVDLTCEYRKNPLGVENKHPMLSWKIQASQKNTLQSAYQIFVSDDITNLNSTKGNIWNSGKINTSQSIQVAFSGKELIAGKTYYWKVKVWDNHGQNATSTLASWQMGLLSPADWKGAKWIAYEKIADSNVNILPVDGKKDTYSQNNTMPIFRKSFPIKKQLKKATLYISGLGHFEASLNGDKIGDHFLDPGWTKYDKEALYVMFDLTKQLKVGQNAIGVLLGNGFYYIPPIKSRYRKLKSTFGYPKMICRLAIEYQDGSTANVTSGVDWKTTSSPITFSSIYGGEDYDANLEKTGWLAATYTDTTWKNAIIVDGPTLNVEKNEPIRVFDNFKAKSISKVNTTGNWVYDLGQNAAGIIELKVSGKRGDTIRITPAELLNRDGSVTQKQSGGPFYFQYILKGTGVETWRPRFAYYGFRYLQVKGGVPVGKENSAKQPVIQDLTALHIRNSAKQVGTFDSSNKLFNQTFSLIDWAVKSNMMSVFTDCPHREKLGWLEQLHLMGSSIRYNYDVAPLFKKALTDMRSSQLANGLVPEIAPEYVKFEWGGDMFRDSPEWGSSSILLPWYIYQWYGDKQTLIENYDMMKKYVDYLSTKANHHILSQGLGDWYDLGPKPPGVSQLTPMGITATAIYYHDLETLTKIANLLGKNTDAEGYKNLAAKVKVAFNEKFYNPTTHQYGSNSQAANAMAIYMELVEPTNKNEVLQQLINDIRSRNNSLTAGDIGYRYVLRVLEDEGRSDVIFDMNSRSDVPGYGYQIANGATALTESWAALSTVSNNHLMLGHLMEWFYSGVGGIRQEEGSIAFSKIKIYPEVVGDLTHAITTYQSPYGLIATEWNKTATSFEITVEIPANTSAIVYLPAKGNQHITNVGDGTIEVLKAEGDRAKVAIGSGKYNLKVR